ncbi:MAG: GGDEF domain-containing protein [Candidatus Acidiferrales bacterium]
MPESEPSQKIEAQQAAVIQDLRTIERKQWWMWSTACMVMILLTLGVASFAFPAILRVEETTYSFYLNQAVRALVAMVILFSVYIVYQQLQITRLRTQLTEQIQSLSKVEVLATEVYKLAALDQLTGLYNRRSGEQRLVEEMSRARRHGRPLTVLVLDLDGLKQVNDKHGHAAGDLMLKTFAERLNRAIRGSDLAVRLGGDEFMILLPECRPEEVRHVLGRLSGVVIECEGEKMVTSFSCGWTDLKPGETPEELLQRADQAMYANKRAGKGQQQLDLAVPQPAR